jgi:hypothetical protein
MKPTFFLRLLIIVAVALELLWFVYPRMGSVMGESYRRRERLEALRAYQEDPSAHSDARLHEELDRASAHIGNRHLLLFGVLLVGDAIAIYLFWNYEPARKTA